MMPRTIVSFLIGTTLLFANAIEAQDQNRTPAGRLTSGVFGASQVFPGTSREYSVYVPAQYAASSPANLMVFMDGRGYANPKGAFRVPQVLDRLISEKAIPTTVAVFVNPGTIKPTIPGAKGRSNRSFEYDSLGNRYSEFLIDEFLPVALRDLNISRDPTRRAVVGISSSGICAFTVAWERPDQFGNVMSHIGSFTNIRGGWAYPGLVRKSHREPKPIKVYLQDGRDDLNNLHGNWPLGNQDLAAALQFAGYKYRFEMTAGGHSGKPGGEVFEEAVKWLWDPDSASSQIPIVNTKPKWEPHPDAVARADVPQGRIEQMPAWESSKVFPGTTRDWWIYVPAQYKASQPAALMVFQDGKSMQGQWRWRVPTVLDNLIAKGEMPVTIGVFINPGHRLDKPRKNGKHSNRGLEYDSLGPRYVDFLLTEILPKVEAKYNLSADPKMHAIGGSSSGAICAFNAAWHRPDFFQRVYCNVGSFTHLRGGNVYPAWVRKTEPKPIRVYMADTSGDVDNAFGSWAWANQRMASSLQYMGYDVKFDWAEGYGHNADFGSRQFPDAMRWLWRSEEHQPRIDTSDDLRGDLTLLDLLVPNENWKLAASDLGFADGLCADKKGNVYFSDMRKSEIYRIDAQSGERSVIAHQSVSGLEFSRDEKTLYACQGSQQRLIAIDMATGQVSELVKGIRPNDLAVAADDWILFTQTGKSQVIAVDPTNGDSKVADTGIAKPNGIAFSPDGGTLAVSDFGGTHTWTFRVGANGSLDAKMPTMPMRLKIDEQGEFSFNEPPPFLKASKGDGMCVDGRGRYYITSAEGVQIFDPTGRPCGVLPKVDANAPLTSCTIGGANHDILFIAHGDKLYKRKLSIERPKR